MNTFKIKEAIELYKENNNKAYEYIKEHKINVLEDEELAFLHISYCIDSGYYEEGLSIRDEFLKMYAYSRYTQEINELFKDTHYEEKAKKYNKKRVLDNDCCFCLDCCCDGLDVCIDCGPGDTGCIDLDLCCFCD